MVVAGIIGRLPVGMNSLGLVLLVRDVGGSYAAAGAVAASYSIGVAAMAPSVGWAIDRWGQTRLLRPTAVAFVVTLSSVVFVLEHDGPGVPAVVLAALAGTTLPPIGSCMRALWPELADSDDSRDAAFALEAVIQEVAFMIGPLIVGLLAVTVSPAAAVLAAGLLGAGGALAFSACGPSRTAHRRVFRGSGHGALRGRGIRTVMLATVSVGVATSAAQVAMPAFSEEYGTPAAAGIILAFLSLGSLVGGIVAALGAARIGPVRRYVVALAVLALALVPLLAAGSVAQMAVLMFLTGVPIAPGFASAYSLLGTLAKPGTATATFAWNTTSIILGSALGSAIGGVCIREFGYRSSITVSVVAASLALAIVLAGRRGLEPSGRAGADVVPGVT